jgi:hypothetical protein
MTEEEWLGCTTPHLLLNHLGHEVSERKLRLFACAWAGHLWRFLADQRSREAVLVAERFVDGLAGRSELAAVFNAAQAAWSELRRAPPRGRCHRSSKWAGRALRAAEAAMNAAHPLWDGRAARRAAAREDWLGNASICNTQCGLLRDLFGTPFRPVRLDPGWLTWRDGLIVCMARSLYQEGRFEDLPILADALEEAGCDNRDVLDHCRSGGEHVRGCWVVDGLLGRQ